MQSPKTYISNRRGSAKEVSDFKCGNVISCHLCHKSVCGISPLLALLWPTVSAVTMKRNYVRATIAQLLSHEEIDHENSVQLPNAEMHSTALSCSLASFYYKAPNSFWKQHQHKNCVGSFIQQTSMAKQLNTSL